jgi:hypothetical protein
MKDTDKLLVGLAFEKYKKDWTDEMISDLIFQLETYLIDKEYGKNQGITPWDVGGKL